MSTLHTNEKCQQCGEPIAFVRMGGGRYVCLEAKPWEGPASDPIFALYFINEEGIAERWGNRPGVDIYVCHTSRPDHEKFKRSK